MFVLHNYLIFCHYGNHHRHRNGNCRHRKKNVKNRLLKRMSYPMNDCCYCCYDRTSCRVSFWKKNCCDMLLFRLLHSSVGKTNLSLYCSPYCGYCSDDRMKSSCPERGEYRHYWNERQWIHVGY